MYAAFSAHCYFFHILIDIYAAQKKRIFERNGNFHATTRKNNKTSAPQAINILQQNKITEVESSTRVTSDRLLLNATVIFTQFSLIMCESINILQLDDELRIIGIFFPR